MSRGDQVAFPADSREARTFAGLSVREHFAAMAMQGLIAGHSCMRDDQQLAAHWAVVHADALLAAFQRPQRGEGE